MIKRKAPFKAGDMVVTDYIKRYSALKRKVIYCRQTASSWVVRVKGLVVDLDVRWFKKV